MPGEEAGMGLDVVLVALKTQHVAAMENPPKFEKDTLLVSMCNGLDSVPFLQKIYPDNTIIHGMFGPNVIMADPATMVKATSGRILFDTHPLTQSLTAIFKSIPVECDTVTNVVSVKWSKLLINTNNAVNALSGLPLGQQLRQQEYRMVWAAAYREGVRICAAEKITPAKITPVAPNIIPYTLEVPDYIFTRIAKQLVSVDERAGSSMLEDVSGGRPTEVMHLNGVLVELGAKHNIATPVNSALVALVQEAEKNKCSPCLTGTELQRKVEELSGWKPVYYSSLCSVM
eukprot:TRINITY_DN12284_c0_g1_i1.p1 TRINITY_DN12284_c0_g1~~TRINITY_DN12284_c0_g1_i1.p1  ORF type:complete len:295 (+),score=63.98 TRINITY_DN12284_c0_g1_i1:27-887(+)